MLFRVFTNKEPDEVSIIETPYGGRIAFVLPEGNMLYVHLKDKLLIRNKKRWSQVRWETERNETVFKSLTWDISRNLMVCLCR